MAAPSKSWVTIADSQVDADSPLDTTLITGLRDDVVHLKEWLGYGYTAAQAHVHDGVDSAQISYSSIPKTTGTELFEDFFGDTLNPQWAIDAYCAVVIGTACGVMSIIVPGNTIGGITVPTVYGNFNLSGGNTLIYEVRHKFAAAYSSLAPCNGFADNTSNGPWNGNQMVFTSDTGTNWLVKTVSAGVVTTTDTGVAVAATSWQKLKIVATASSVKFYIDNVLKATHTTNIPTAGMDVVTFIYRVTSGATAYIDYILASSSVRNN